jgi:hypothetical protein
VDAPLISVAAPVLPPGIGFCVVAMDGRVLLHSERQRSLRENFFEECDWDERLVRLTAARAQGHIEDIDYLGRVHSFNVRPLAHQSWSLIVFRDEGPLSAFNFQITIVSLVLLAGWLLAAGAMALLAWGLLALLKTMGVKPPWASLPDPMRPILGMLRPDHDGRPAYIALTLANLAVVVGTLIWVLTTDSTVSMAAAAICGAVLGLSGVCFGLATSRGLAVATSVGNVIREVIRMARGGATSLHARAVAAPHGYGRTLISVLLLLSVIPAIACQRIAHQLGARHYLKHSLRQVASALQARDELVTAGYRDYKLPAGFLADRLNLASPPGGTRNWDVYTGHFFSTRAEPGATLEAPAGPDLFDDVFSLMGSDRDAPMLLLTEAHDRSWRFEQSGPGRLAHAQGQFRLTAENPTLVNEWEPWQVLLGAVGLLLAYSLTRFIVRRVMLVHIKPEHVPQLAEHLQLTHTEHLLVLDDSLSVDDRTLQERLGPECWTALQKRSHVVCDLRQGLPPDGLAENVGGLIVLDHFEHRWHDPGFNRQRQRWIERVLTQGGPTLLIISTLHPDHFVVAEPRSNSVKTRPSKPEKPAPAARWFTPLRLSYLSLPVPAPQESTGQNEARFRRYWGTCSKDEQLALAHLSRDGLIQPKNREVSRLLGRGLVVARPRVQVYDPAFAAYALKAGEAASLRQYEQASIHSLWASMQLPLSLLLLGVFFVLALARPHFYTALASLLPLLAIVPSMVQKVRSLLAFVGGADVSGKA